ncbi:FtsX-like permease family protein [Lachnospiraceae bacterium 54-53]
MKNYLELVPVSAKVHRNQNRMSIFCIILAVFLVTVIFGMADMFIRSQIIQTRMEEGNWHAAFRDISEEEADLISLRPETKAFSWYGVLNYGGDQGYTLSGKNLVICGSDESWISSMHTDMMAGGVFPRKDKEALITENARDALGLKTGDQFSVDTPEGTSLMFTVSGFFKDASKTMEEDSYAVFLTTNGYRSIYPGAADGEPSDYNIVYYVQFSSHGDIQGTIGDIKTRLGLSEQQVSENTKLLGLLGQSGNSFMMQIYGSAFVLFLLVLLAGIIMIASSLNSDIARRTEFFGMIRCIGATPKQVMKLVQKEALGWCKYAVPFGLAAGIVVVWILCAMLRFLSPEYFKGMPALGMSFPGIFSGLSVAMLTVLLAARSPARRASRVSPLAAVSGGANGLRPVPRAAGPAFFKIDTALGIRHAGAGKKNFFLMVGSFSLSIVLFLSFSVTVDFMNHTLTPLKPWTPDISIISPDNTGSIGSGLLEQLQKNPAVKRVYGRMFAYSVPVWANDKEIRADLISYEENQFRWAKDYMLEGSLDEVRKGGNAGLIVFEQQNTIQVGDTVALRIGDRSGNMRIAGMLSSSPFNNAPDVGTVICSENTFRQLTGQSGYTIIDLQLSKHASEADVDQIRRMAGPDITFSDRRLTNRGIRGSYYSFGLFIYGFLVLIALITIFNIMNSIAMSVASRTKQYGILRAVGMSVRQLEKMIIAEALTYAVTGSACGSIAGLVLNKFIYEKMVTFHWGEQWNIPFHELGVIVTIVVISVMIAVKGPVKRIRSMSIVDTIGAQ